MKPQAVRRSKLYLSLRARWRRLDVATQADLILGSLLLTVWGVLSLALPLLVRA